MVTWLNRSRNNVPRTRHRPACPARSGGQSATSSTARITPSHRDRAAEGGPIPMRVDVGTDLVVAHRPRLQARQARRWPARNGADVLLPRTHPDTRHRPACPARSRGLVANIAAPVPCFLQGVAAAEGGSNALKERFLVVQPRQRTRSTNGLRGITPLPARPS